MTPRLRYWSRFMRSKLLGGFLIGVALMVLVVTQVLFPGFSLSGWVVGLALFLAGGFILLAQ